MSFCKKVAGQGSFLVGQARGLSPQIAMLRSVSCIGFYECQAQVIETQYANRALPTLRHFYFQSNQ